MDNNQLPESNFYLETHSDRIAYILSVILCVTQTKFCAATGLSVNTLRYWERRNSNLTVNSARKLVVAFEKFGIRCDRDWLIHGIGAPPQKIPKLGFTAESNATLKLSLEKTLDEDFAILKETEAFQILHPHAIFFINIDETMEPKYLRGEILAGIAYRTQDIAQMCLGKVCIVQTEDKRKLLRKVTPGSQKNTFSMTVTNPNFVKENFESHLEFAAPVLWQRIKS